ncbi:hypothetical protein K7W03_01060 [Sphingobium sp. PNB]|uniref:hypothetical protein n=1 Tax=Sphingobium sp. PNB TaxID=863934 RepID=UPI001CA44721|nr:hypothetical protein [Sphingobium sp. PNB]MCB4858175.1 hypothetical protein [Sphingobium sp. PNB]
MAEPRPHHPRWLSRPFLTASAFTLTLAIHGQALANPFGVTPVSDESLSDMRGGFDLPNGMRLSLGVEIATFVDNSLALRTVLHVTEPGHSGVQVTVPVSSAALGAVSVAQAEGGAAVMLKGPDLEIQHLAGSNTGVLIANTLDNRSIDTIANVNIALGDAAVPVGNMILRIESVVLDAVRAGI